MDTEDASTGLFYELLDARHHRVELLTQPLKHQLLQGIFRALDAVNDLL